MKTVTKKDLVDRIADSTGLKRVSVKTVVQQFLDEIIRELGAGNRLEFRDFGVFEIRERAARIAQNPKTMEKVPVPRKRTVKFKVGRLMRERLQYEGQSMPEDAIPTSPQPQVRRDGAVSYPSSASNPGA
ncbi:MAG: integration host factor subunit beta [Planctomycetota bacterium]|nr:MAG: integration host factor subunit beta [Planctomycetota bacterium]